MKKFMSVLLILICGMFAACSDNVYEKENQGMIVVCKEIREDVTHNQPWKFEYKITDFSSEGGNQTGQPGNFYYYTSSNFLVGDTLSFTTTASLREMHANVERITTLETDLLTFISTKALSDSLQTTVDNQGFRLSKATAVVDSLFTRLATSRMALQKSDQVNEKNIKLQEELKTAQAQILKLNAFKDSMKDLVK